MFLILYLASIAVAFAFPSPINGNTQRVTLPTRSLITRQDGQIDGSAFLASVNRARVKYGWPPLPTPPMLAGRSNVQLTDNFGHGLDEDYYGQVLVGSQAFTADFDTGSADFWVPGPSCSVSFGCVGSVRYSQTGQSQNKSTGIEYGSGYIEGGDFKDTVSVGGLSVTNQGFISVGYASGMSNLGASSLMGMAFGSLAATGYPTFFENLISQGKVSKPEFAFYLGRGASGDGNHSELTLGGADSFKYSGPLTKVPVTNATFWQLAVGNVTVDSQSVGEVAQGQAYIDTGTSIVLAPNDVVAAITKAIPNAELVYLSGQAGQGFYLAYPCSTPARYIPSFTFAGQSFSIDPADFNMGYLAPNSSLVAAADAQNPLRSKVAQASDPYCVGAIVPVDIGSEESLYIVGDTFLKSWYSVFSYDGPSVSFARAV